MSRPRTPRSHDGAIRALRAEALECVKLSEEFERYTKQSQSRFRFDAAALTLAADYLASITGKVERVRGKARDGRNAR